MKKFVKLDLSFGERLKVFFFGLVDEEKLPKVEVVKEVEKEKIIIEKHPEPQKETINIKDDKEEEFHVPFFELQDDDVKSNF